MSLSNQHKEAMRKFWEAAEHHDRASMNHWHNQGAHILKQMHEEHTKLGRILLPTTFILIVTLIILRSL